MEKVDPLLSVKDLKTQFFTYGGVVQALDEVSFEIHSGEVFGLVGESGCGKSVTVSSILGLVQKPGRIVSGRIDFKSENLLEKSERQMNDVRGSSISIIFQDPTSSLNPLFKIGYQVAEPLIYHQYKKNKEAQSRAVELLKRMGIPDPAKKAKCYPFELSGGMRQRVMIAMALACQPDLLIADEPTTNLDVTIERQILSLVRELQAETGTSLLWITHDLAIIAEMCDRVGVMYAGNIVEVADVKTLFRDPRHPYTVKLLKAIPSEEHSVDVLDEIPGAVPQLISPPPGCRFHPRCEHAMEICKVQKPAVNQLNSDHSVACHLAAEEGR